MANVKVSELTQVASVALTDLFEISRNTGSGWESCAINMEAIHEAIHGTRTIIVSQTGGDVLTIRDGLVKALAMSPTPTSPVVLQVQSGVYVENNPLVVPPYVSIMGIGGSSTIVIPTNPTTNVFDMGTYSRLASIAIQGAAGPGGTAIYTYQPFVQLQDVTIFSCETGVRAYGPGALVYCNLVNILITPPTVLQNGFLCEAGAFVNAIGCAIQSVTGPANAFNGMASTGAGSRLYVFSVACDGMSRACYCNDGAKMVITGGVLQSGTNGLHIGSTGTGSRIIACGADMVGNGAYDIWISNGVNGVVSLSGKYDGWKRFIGTGGTLASIAQDGSIDGSRGTGRFVEEGPMEIGYPGQHLTGQDLNLNIGEGASTRLDQYGVELVEYWSYDASAPSGSKFARYTDNAGVQLADINDAIVVGQVYPYADIRYNTLTAANVGSANIVVEYWNGSAWVDTPFATWNRSTFATRLDRPFQNVESQFIEVSVLTPNLIIPDYDQLDEIPAWDYADYLYPVRYRNNGASLVSGMTFNVGYAKPDSWTVGISKRQILYGSYRKPQGEKIVIAASEMDPNPNAMPAPFTANVSSHIVFEYPYSLFAENNVSALSFPIAIPWWVDTATPLKFEIIFAPTNSNVGSVHFDMYYTDVYDGKVFDGANPERHVNFDTNTMGTPYLLQVAEVDIDIRSEQPGHIHRIVIERDDISLPDTYEGDVAILRAEAYFTRKLVS